MNKRFFLCILITVAVSFGFSCKSKTVVKKLANKNSSTSSKTQTNKIDGVMYHLPKTIVQVTVPITKTTRKPGDYVKFAKCFFPASELKDIEAKDEKFSIGDPILSTRGVPDTSETFVLSTKGKYFESKTLFMEYAPGTLILQKGTAESKNEGLEFTMKAIATAAGIAAKLTPLGLGNDAERKEQMKELTLEYRCFQKIGAFAADAALEPQVKGDMQRALGVSAAALDADGQVTRMTTPIDIRSEYQTAKALYDNLVLLTGQRDAVLANGGSAAPADTFKQQLERNAEAIKAHKAAFLGIKSAESWSPVLEFEPQKGVAENYSSLLLSYTENGGVCNAGWFTEKNIPVKSDFENKTCADTAENKVKTLWLKVVKSPDQDFLNNVEAAIENSDKSRGWYYRIPANSIVNLQTQELNCLPKPGGAALKYSCLINSFAISDAWTGGNKIKAITTTYSGVGGSLTTIMKSSEMVRSETPIAQFGIIASVPASTAGRSSATEINLDPATGAMKNYKSSSTPLLDKAMLDDAAKAANSAIDAADPLTRKKRELELLKIQNDINEQKKKLENSNTSDKDQ